MSSETLHNGAPRALRTAADGSPRLPRVAYDDDGYPYADGAPLAQNSPQCDQIVYAFPALRALLRRRFPGAFAASDMLIYPQKGDLAAAVAPDVFVAFAAGDHARNSYKLWVRRVHRRAMRKPLIVKAKKGLTSLRQQPTTFGWQAAKAASTVGATRLLRRGAFQFPSGSRLAAICAVATRGDITSTRCNGGHWNTVQSEPWAHRCTVVPPKSTSKRAGEAVCAIVPHRSLDRCSGTSYAANRSLRAVHRWQRRCAKRPDNVPPRIRGPATARKPMESASYTSGQGTRLAGKVNVRECADKCRDVEQAEVANTLEPKWYVVRSPLPQWGDAAISTTGKQATPNPALLHRRNSVSPSLRPFGGRGAARRTVAVAGKGWWRKQMPRCNGADTGMEHVRRGNPCQLPPGRSLRDDLSNPSKGAHIGFRRHGHPRRRGDQTRPLRGYELQSPASTEDSV